MGDEHGIVRPDRSGDQLRRRAIDAFHHQDWSTLDNILDELVADRYRVLLVEIVSTLGLARPAIAKVLVSESDIDDAEQTTLLKLNGKLDTFDGRSRFRTWLYTMATNEARMLVRHQATRPGPADPQQAAAQQGSDPATPNARNRGTGFAPTTRHSSIVADRLDLAEAIDRIDEPFRTALLLRDVDGLEYAEIAERLGCAIGTVSSRVARGRAMLEAGLGRGF